MRRCSRSLERRRVPRAHPGDLGRAVGGVDHRRRSVPHSPASMTASTWWSSSSLTSQPSVIGASPRAGSACWTGSAPPARRAAPARPGCRGSAPRRSSSSGAAAAGHLLGARQDERVGPRRRRLDRPEHPVVDVDQLPELGEVRADEGEVVLVVEAAGSARSAPCPPGCPGRSPARSRSRSGRRPVPRRGSAAPPGRWPAAAGRPGARRDTAGRVCTRLSHTPPGADYVVRRAQHS